MRVLDAVLCPTPDIRLFPRASFQPPCLPACLLSVKKSCQRRQRSLLVLCFVLPAGIQFAPDEDAVLEELNAAVEGIISVAQQVNIG
jgi:hypothetical protein